MQEGVVCRRQLADFSHEHFWPCGSSKAEVVLSIALTT